MWTFPRGREVIVKTQRELALEKLALRQLMGVLTRTLEDRRPRLGVWDRGFWVVFSQGWAGWKEALAIVQPATVIGGVTEFPEVGGLHHRYERAAA